MFRRLTDTPGLSDIQEQILATVRSFVDREILPYVAGLDHNDEFPEVIVDKMRSLGLFGLTIEEQFGGVGESLLTYSLVVEELSRGWMSLSGILNTHFIVAYLLNRYGTVDQQSALLTPMAMGDLRAAFSMSEPDCGSDVAGIKSRATRVEGGYLVNGRKMWVTNGARAGVVALLVLADEREGLPPHKNMLTLLVEKEPGFGEVAEGLLIPPKIEKMGYKGVETTELCFNDFFVAEDRVLGGIPGRGFYQMMDGIEVGRVNVAARATGLALRAFELAITYAQQRQAFGKIIANHQAVLFRLAEMGSKVAAAHQLVVMAARRKDSGERNDLEASTAKYLASEFCKEVVEDAVRIHGGYGYSKEFEIERLYRDAPMLLIGEGTSDIQKMIIGHRLLEEYRI